MGTCGETYDVIVLGAGIMGLSSAYFCQNKGLRVLLLEQFSLTHTRGSSHGITRGIRKAAYLESPQLGKMMAEAEGLWKDIETATQTQLFIKTGTLIVEPNPAPQIKQCALMSDRLGYDYTVFDEHGLNLHYKNVMSFPGYSGFLDHSGGILRADLCCSKTFELFCAKGGKFMEMTKVKSIKPGQPTEIVTDKGRTFYCQKLIVAAGPWSGDLLGQLGLDLPLQPLAVTVCYWKTRSDFGMGHFPSFYDAESDVYAFPTHEYPGVVKLVSNKTHVPCRTPEMRDSTALSIAEIMETYGPYLKKHFPNLESQSPAIVERCLYTKTPDGMWIIDKHPEFHNIVVLAGFSGHGFKAGSLVGKMAYQLLSGADLSSQYDMSEFSIKRFTAPSSHL